jgi:internalin A
VADISPLGNLTRLRQLDLSANQVTDISALAQLTDLGIVDLSNNQISDDDMSTIGGWTLLTELNLSTNQVSDISNLDGLTMLSILELGANQILDLSAVTSLIGITGLYLYNNQLNDISPLVDHPKLGDGHVVDIRENANLDCEDQDVLDDIAALEARGVILRHDCED